MVVKPRSTSPERARELLVELVAIVATLDAEARWDLAGTRAFGELRRLVRGERDPTRAPRGMVKSEGQRKVRLAIKAEGVAGVAARVCATGTPCSSSMVSRIASGERTPSSWVLRDAFARALAIAPESWERAPSVGDVTVVTKEAAKQSITKPRDAA